MSSVAQALIRYASSGGKSVTPILEALRSSRKYPPGSMQSRPQALGDGEGGGSGDEAASTIQELARRYSLDPNAVIAVAMGEGGLRNRSGDIGDLAGGGSYGPFQLYAQGALPARYRGNPKAADKWAWSREGINYALSRMAKAGASGLTGRAAIEAIVRKFERPADPSGSIARAVSRYGSAPTQGSRGSSNGVRELFYDPAGAYDEGNWIAPIGGHSDHVHVSFGTPQAALSAIQQARRFGLSARENPYVDPVDPVHTQSSYHYSNFPGQYSGRSLGRAVDVSGNPQQMRRYYQWVRRTYIGS